MMRRALVAIAVLALMLAAAARGAEEAPWKRVLKGDNAKKAAEQEKKLLELQEAGRFKEALKIAEALAELRAKVQGADHWQAVDARFAVETIRRVLRAKKEEQQSYSHVFVLGRQAGALQSKGHYREAQSKWEQILSISHKVLGTQHPMKAHLYNALAGNLYRQVKYPEAEEAIRKALAISGQVLGEQHPVSATNYNALAYILNAQGKYREAEKSALKALAIYRQVLGKEHAITATSYGLLGLNLNAQGKYRQAEVVYRQALAISRKVLGEEHRNTAASYNNVAHNLNDQGRYREAEECYRQALAISRMVLGEEHSLTATIYNNLALSLQAQGKYREAEQSHRQALTIHRKVVGEERPATAQSYNNLASSLYAQGKYREAEEDYRKALAICRKVLGDEHPDTARTYNNVATLLSVQGKYREAEEQLRQAIAISRKVLGEEHPATATYYTNLALGLYWHGKYEEAEESFLHSADSFTKARRHVATTGLERATFTSDHSPLLPFAAVLARNGKPDDAWQRFEESLARGTWDDLSARLRRPQTERDKQAQITARIDRLNQLIAQTPTAKPTPEQTKQRQKRLSQLRQAYDELAAFTRQLEKQYGPIAGQVFSRGQIQKSLPQDAACVAWLDIAGQRKAKDPNGEHWAILLRSSGDPIWVRLSGSGDKDAWTDADTRLPARLRSALQTTDSAWQSLAERLRKQRLQPLAPYLRGVRRLIVLPSTALAGVPLEVLADGYTVSYAHSGTMYAYLRQQKAPRGAGLLALADPVFDPPSDPEKPQPLPPGGVLLTLVLPRSNAARAGLKPNDVLLRYGETDLTDPKDLKPQPEAKDAKKLVPVMVRRDGQKRKQPIYVRPGKLGVVLAAEPAPQAVADQRRLDRSLAFRGGDDGDWKRLPGTRIEAAALQCLFDKDAPVQLLLHSDASEQRLNELAQRGELGKYRYLHLATHGEVNNAFPLRSAVILSRDHLPDDRQRTELLLSGQAIPDGRLTAEEVLRRWELHADLVTLSACQTALGKYERGEGFVGFAQSLILCGTRSVCLSLWKVDDTATALLMTRFYENLLGKRKELKKPLPKAAALREAKQWLRTLRQDECARLAAHLAKGELRGTIVAAKPETETPREAADTPYAHPHYWAAFILMGDPD